MADDETVKGRSAARSASRTASTVRSAGHTASGGHSFTTIANRWRHQPDGQHQGHRMNAWHEYPKAIYPDEPDGKYRPGAKAVIVNSSEEEEIALGGKPVVREADERSRLLKVAEVKGVTVDGRWSLKRIAETIEAQGFDPSLDPFK